MDGDVTIDAAEFSNSPGSSAIIGGCLIAVLGLLRASPVPNWIGNWIIVSLGIVAQGSVSGWSVMSAMQGIIVGASAIGTYKTVTETTNAGRDKVPNTGDTEFVKKDKP